MKNTIFAVSLITALSISCTAIKDNENSKANLIGGKLALEGQYPATISLRKALTLRQSCTAAMISKRHILTAAHCVVTAGEFIPRPRTPIVLRTSLVDSQSNPKISFAVGTDERNIVTKRIVNIHVPNVTIKFLTDNAREAWASENLEEAQDLAVIELESDVPESVGVASIASASSAKGTKFRFGGYGCETSPLFPAEAPILRKRGASENPLKYAQSQIEELRNWIGIGGKFSTGTTNQSACNGDSGGPVYFDSKPDDENAKLTSIIGVNSFGTPPSKTKGGEQIGFTVVTPESKPGQWVRRVLEGQEQPLVLQNLMPEI